MTVAFRHRGKLAAGSEECTLVDLHVMSVHRLSCTMTENLTERRESVQKSVSIGTVRANDLCGQGEDVCQREDYGSP